MGKPHYQRNINLDSYDEQLVKDLIEKGYKVVDIFRSGILALMPDAPKELREKVKRIK